MSRNPGTLGTKFYLRAQELSGINVAVTHKPREVNCLQADVAVGVLDSWRVVSGIFTENTAVALYCERPGTVLSTSGDPHKHTAAHLPQHSFTSAIGVGCELWSLQLCPIGCCFRLQVHCWRFAKVAVRLACVFARCTQ